MAKKVVATLQTGEGRSWSKVIKMVRSEKTGAYVFEERMVPNDKVQEGRSTISACPPAEMISPRADFVLPGMEKTCFL